MKHDNDNQHILKTCQPQLKLFCYVNDNYSLLTTLSLPDCYEIIQDPLLKNDILLNSEIILYL